MTKPNVQHETKEAKFKRIASQRTQKILDNLRLLGNCANKAVYSYAEEDISKIFGSIDRELKRVRALYMDSKKTFQL